jgi:hypothetical protein
MLQSNPLLEDVGLVIFDEFHERSIHADVALALCREAQQLLRPDLRIIRAMLMRKGSMIHCIPQEFKEDRVYICIALKNDISLFETLSDEWRDNYDVVLTAVSTDGYCLKFASERLRNDKSIVLAAAENNGEAFNFASEELKN